MTKFILGMVVGATLATVGFTGMVKIAEKGVDAAKASAPVIDKNINSAKMALKETAK